MFTKCCACHESALRGSPSAVPATNLHFEVHQVLCLPRNLYFEVHQVLCLPRNLQTSHISKSHDSLRLSRNLSSSTITAMSKVLHENCIRSKTAPTPCTCHEKSTLEHQNDPLAPTTKSDHHVRKCARHHDGSAVVRSTRRKHPDSASLRSRNAHGRCREA